VLVRVIAGLAAATALPAVGAAQPDRPVGGSRAGDWTLAPPVQMRTIRYRSHNGARRNAYVLLPSWYGPGLAPPIPLLISPHGRGLTGRQNTALWGALPARGPFAVVSPDGHGRRLAHYSWGFAGQIDDLARMPAIVRSALPWLRIDQRRIYAFGGSMGGQETLLLAARHPRLLAGAAAFDSVADLALQYRAFPRLRCHRRCRRAWAQPLGRGLQELARYEVGGTPRTAARAYRRRSPLAYARTLATSCVPIQFWWSVADRVVLDQRRQSARLFWRIRTLNRRAPVQAFVGSWVHTAEMHARSRLPHALATFGLIPAGPQPRGRQPRGRLRVVRAPAGSHSCGRRR
jgi:poly(3-hydroxybutyrate) depolymerase